MKIILASKSGVRRDILKQNQIECEVIHSNVDEDQVKESLIDKGANVTAHDPEGMTNFKEIVDIPMTATPELATEKADCVILMTEWEEYQNLDLELLLRRMAGNVLIDGRRALNSNEAERVGFDYKTIGLG